MRTSLGVAGLAIRGAILLGALAAGCTTIGTGPDSTDSSAGLVNFNLKSPGAVSGSINGTVPDDEPPSGQFF
jgi:hypothetical protein